MRAGRHGQGTGSASFRTYKNDRKTMIITSITTVPVIVTIRIFKLRIIPDKSE